jgi:hypothetical protein
MYPTSDTRCSDAVGHAPENGSVGGAGKGGSAVGGCTRRAERGTARPRAISLVTHSCGTGNLYRYRCRQDVRHRSAPPQGVRKCVCVCVYVCARACVRVCALVCALPERAFAQMHVPHPCLPLPACLPSPMRAHTCRKGHADCLQAYHGIAHALGSEIRYSRRQKPRQLRPL